MGFSNYTLAELTNQKEEDIVEIAIKQVLNQTIKWLILVLQNLKQNTLLLQ